MGSLKLRAPKDKNVLLAVKQQKAFTNSLKSGAAKPTVKNKQPVDPNAEKPLRNVSGMPYVTRMKLSKTRDQFKSYQTKSSKKK